MGRNGVTELEFRWRADRKSGIRRREIVRQLVLHQIQRVEGSKTVIHSQIERYHTVTAGTVRQRILINTRLVIKITVPEIAVANRRVNRALIRAGERDRDGCIAAAIPCNRGCYGIFSRRGHGDG